MMLIICHTHNVGSERYNLRLTQNRNEQIINYFNKKGYDITNIKTMPCGEKLPIASNYTPEGQAQNRRKNHSFRFIQFPGN